MKTICIMKATLFTSTAKIAVIYYAILIPTIYLEEITCSSNCYCDEAGEYISCVGDGVWDMLPDVPRTAVSLELRNYIIPSLSSGQLHGLVELHELKLQQTQTKYVENGTFSNLNYLRHLELSQNLITNLTSSTFEGLQRLRYLDMSSNLLVGIDESFLKLSSVEQLNLRANNIARITSHSFYGLRKVQRLNLDSNQITYIEVGSFQYLTDLVRLILSNNPLTALSRLDFFGSRLQYIDMSRMGLERVPQSLTKFVRDLRLAKNNLTRISAGDFDSYPYLGLLVLDDNSIIEIESDALGRQEYLIRLWLNGNSLRRVPDNFPPSLWALYMENNDLVGIHGYSFKGLVNLQQLFLQRNKICHLSECAFCDLLSLKSLDLQANRIENVADGVFANLTLLETLDLSQNCIKVIDAHCFKGLTNVKTLKISRISTIVSFDDSIFDYFKSLQMLEIYDSPNFAVQITNSSKLLRGLKSVRILNIMHNKLTNLRPDFPTFFPNLKVIKISGNKWHCNRQIVWLLMWIQKPNVHFYQTHNIRCSSPPNLKFKPIVTLGEDDVISEDPTDIETTQQYRNSQSIITSIPEKYHKNVSSNISKHERSISMDTEMPLGEADTQELLNLTKEASETVEYNVTTETTVRHTETEPLLIKSSKSQTSQKFKPGKETSTSSSTTHGLNHISAIIITTSIASATLVLLVSIVISFTFYNWYYKYRTNGSHFLLRRSNSISYYAQQDQVSIVTVSDTRMHHGLGNKLYYITENGDIFQEPIRDDDFPDPQLHELLPNTETMNQSGSFEDKQTDIDIR